MAAVWLTFCVPLSLLMLQADTTLRLMEACTPLVSEFPALVKSHQYCCFFHATLSCVVLLCPVRHCFHLPKYVQSTHRRSLRTPTSAPPAKTWRARRNPPGGAPPPETSLFVQRQGGWDTFNLKIHLPHQPKLQIDAAAVRITQSQTQLSHKEKFDLWHVVREPLTWRNSRRSQNVILLPVIVTDRGVTIPSKSIWTCHLKWWIK